MENYEKNEKNSVNNEITIVDLSEGFECETFNEIDISGFFGLIGCCNTVQPN